MKTILTCILFLQLIVFVKAQSTSVLDASYFEHINATPPIKIGRGFHMNDIYRQTRPCFKIGTVDPDKLTPQQRGTRTDIQVYYTRTNAEFNELKSNGASGSITFLNMFSFGGKHLKSYENEEIEDQEHIVFVAKVDFGVFSFDVDPVLNPEAKSLITQGKLQEFIDMYGTHYVSGIRKESSISVILTKARVKSSTKEQESSSVNGKVNVPNRVNGSFEVENTEWLNQQFEEYDFSFSIELNGPTLDKDVIYADINAALKSNDNSKVTLLQNIILGSLEGVSDPKYSLITQYYYSPFSLYGLKGIYWDEKKQSRLQEINRAIAHVYAAKSHIDVIVSLSGKDRLREEIKKYNVPEIQYKQIMMTYESIIPKLKQYKIKASQYLTELESCYNRCSDVLCSKNDVCCNNDSLIDDVNGNDLDGKTSDELAKIMRVVENVSKELNRPECEKQGKGVISIKNLSVNPYTVTIDGNYLEVIPGKTQKTYYITLGSFKIKAVQVSGYLVYPTVNYRNVIFSSVCQNIVVSIGYED